MTVRAHAIVSGRVQGVAFRAAALDEAERLGGLGGWIRNRHDGTVEAVIEGDRARVEAMLAWLHDGPRLARVDHVEVSWEPPRGEASGFDIHG